MGIVYAARNRINSKMYIGQTIQNLSDRICDHYRCSKIHDYKFARALRKYNKEDWNWHIIYNNVETSNLDIAEICAIYIHDTYHSGYNSTEGGDFNPMKYEKNRIKMARSMLGKGNPMYGRRHSDITKSKQSQRKKGKPKSIEHRQKMSESRKGHEFNAKCWKVTMPCGETEIIKNLAKYCRENNLNAGHMVKVANGQYANHKGYMVERLFNANRSKQ